MADKIAGGSFLLEARKPEEVFTPEDFSEEHKMILNTTWDFIKGEVLTRIDQIEAKDEALSRRLMLAAGELGLLGTDVPEAYGGLGLDQVSTACVTEAFGAAGSFAVTEGAHTGIGLLPIVYFGTEEQKQKYLPKLASGEWLGAFALTEPGAGSDALNAAAKAVLSEDGQNYVLNGEKIFITNAGWAQTFIVFAKVDGQDFTAFIVERDTPGLSTGAEEDKMGIRGSSTCSVILEDALVPAANVLGEIGKGHRIAFNILDVGRHKLAVATVGGSKWVIAEAAKYANQRVQFKMPLAKFGMIQEKLADMAIKTYVTEAMIYRTSDLIEKALVELEKSGLDFAARAVKAFEEYSMECSINKVYGSEMIDFVVDEYLQILGGYGYVAEYPAERIYRDARINRIFEGTNEVNRLLVPGTVMKRAMKGRLPLLNAAQALAGEVMTFSPLAVEIPEGPLGFQSHMIEMTRKALILVAGVAAQKYMDKLIHEQEVLARLADMCIQLFAMESALLRAQKKIDKDGQEAAALHIAAVQAYLDDTLPRVETWGKQILAHVEEGDMLKTQLMALRKFTKNQPIDVVAAKRLVAAKVFDREAYPFD
ncbi:MAG: acyl-CoA dehydrogenase family protein [Deltaproteobacteria bacterium]|nr:acyl-CoA dehydrogenase family protein [Deltaproteobacteria bacterium]